MGKLEAHFPNLMVLGLSAGGEESAEVLKALAARQFAGQILLLGPGGSPMLSALQEFGGKLGLAMLPVLSTPFGSQTLRASVAALLPQAVPQPPIDLAEAMSAGWLELWYQPKVDTHTLAVKGAEALIRIRHPNWGIVTPAYFIPDDRDPQFRALAEFTIEQSIQDWHDFVAESGPIEIAINHTVEVGPVSGSQKRTDLIVPLPALQPGHYQVHWETTSSDSHRIQGDFEFEIRP